jgi:hypothetical protein
VPIDNSYANSNTNSDTNSKTYGNTDSYAWSGGGVWI